MKFLNCVALTGALTFAPVAFAGPAELLATYSTEAPAGFAAAASRGEAFFKKRFGVSEKLSACSSCHTDNPRQNGRHVVTGKDIKPLSPLSNAERFTDRAKVEKWFHRNCTEVVGRDCTAAEKADLIRYLTQES